MKFVRSLFLICFALLLTFGFYAALSFFDRAPLHPAQIKAIAQTGPVKEAFKTDYLAELLNLSVDKPQTLIPEEGEKLLLNSLCIKKAHVSLLDSETLLIDYTIRTPQFILGDVENLALDDQGIPFPLHPYYSPKRIPLLYLGKEHHQEKKSLARQLLKILGDRTLMIDVSKCMERSLGKREVVVEIGTHLLRLSPNHYQQQLKNYYKIKENYNNQRLIFDLRLPKLAYLHPRDK